MKYERACAKRCRRRRCCFEKKNTLKTEKIINGKQEFTIGGMRKLLKDDDDEVLFGWNSESVIKDALPMLEP